MLVAYGYMTSSMFILGKNGSTAFRAIVKSIYTPSQFRKITLVSNTLKASTMATNHYTTVSYVTTPNEEVARDLSKRLVEKRLAACVNIVKTIESVYEWQDKIEHDNESLMIIKSNSSKTKDLTEFVVKNHPYDCPEVVTLKIDSGNKSYVDWIHETVNKKPLDKD